MHTCGCGVGPDFVCVVCRCVVTIIPGCVVTIIPARIIHNSHKKVGEKM